MKAAGLRIWPFVHSHQGKYDLRMFYDPVISDWLGQGPDWGTGVHVIDPHADPIRDITKVPLSFDMERPLVPQIEEAKTPLKAGQHRIERLMTPRRPEAGVPKTPILRRDKWQFYLQALDGRSRGASLNEIAKILPGSMGNKSAQAVDNVLRQARAVRFSFRRYGIS